MKRLWIRLTYVRKRLMSHDRIHIDGGVQTLYASPETLGAWHPILFTPQVTADDPDHHHRLPHTGWLVLRRPVQQELFAAESPNVRYTIMASNREETAETTVRWYNQRGETSENRIKELKL